MSITADVAPLEASSLPQAVQDLVAHLRQSSGVPEASAALAERFGVDVDLVRDIQSCLRAPIPYESPTEGFVRGLSQALRQVTEGVGTFWLRISSRPIPFLLATSLVFLILFLLTNAAANTSSAVAGSNVTIHAGAQAGPLVLVLLLLHMLCYARHGRARYPLIGTFIAFTCIAGASILVTGAALVVGQFRPALAVQSIFAGLVLAIPYATLGMAASVVGGYFRARREIRSELRLSRQELLDRLFEIESRLRETRRPANLLTPIERFVREMRHSPGYPGFAAASGFALGVVDMVVKGSMMGFLRNSATLLLELVQLAFTLAVITTFLLVGYVAGNVRRSIAGLFIAFLASAAVTLLPFGGFGWTYFVETFFVPGTVLTAALLATVGLFTGLGAEMEARASLSQRLSQNDLPVLLAEMIRIQRRLGRSSQSACVMVVDVARSTRMKADNDSLRIEWSFRAYQELLAEISIRYGGQIISTAGDGAVVNFPGCQEALDAAREIQTEMPKFNSRKNRLSSPFGVRIGLHTGETETQISDAPFNTLIDIAAHIEGVAPIGGIAISGVVASQLREEELAAMKEDVDGQPVFIVLNPTFGA